MIALSATVGNAQGDSGVARRGARRERLQAGQAGEGDSAQRQDLLPGREEELFGDSRYLR